MSLSWPFFLTYLFDPMWYERSLKFPSGGTNESTFSFCKTKSCW